MTENNGFLRCGRQRDVTDFSTSRHRPEPVPPSRKKGYAATGTEARLPLFAEPRFDNSSGKIAEKLKKAVGGKSVVLLCVGSDKVCGDSLGPMIGSIMSKRNLPNVYVYGMLESNITAKNLAFAAKFVEAVHPDRKIIVVDAALGTREQVGTVQIIKGGLYPGSATNKNLPKVGDVGVLGVVNERLQDEMEILYSTKMNAVRVLAHAIADGLTGALS